jgi:16S rRNA (uracil1498-N3)-methyltransferase
MHRFYCQNADFSLKNFTITDRNEVHHIKDVLRLKIEDEVFIFNGRNQEARAKIAGFKGEGVQVRIEAVRETASTAPRAKIILACAVPKKAKFEFIIEKCTELGVDEIIPLRTKRTEVIFSQEKIPAKQERFQKVAVNAAKQCGRLDIPQILPMISLPEALEHCGSEILGVIASLNGRPQHIRDVLTGRGSGRSVLILIGPEGDFTPDEVQLAQDKGCVPVSLGTTVLKVDTAAIATVALARFLLE